MAGTADGVENLAEEPAGLAFRAFGSLAVVRDGQSLDLGGPQQRAVLALLVVKHNEVVSTDQLLDVVWSEELPRTALQTLRVYVSRLRRSLAESSSRARSEVLVTEPGGYRLAVAPVQVDIYRFEALVDHGRAALEAGDEALAEHWLTAALRTAPAPLLQGLLDNAFTRNERERLEELRLSAIEELIDARLELGRHRELVGELKVLVGEHPERERLWGQLMVALYRCGRQAEALQTYGHARGWLVTELGVEPAEHLQRVEQMVLLQDPALDIDAEAVHGAPTYLSTFVGRPDLAEVIRRVGKHRLMTLVGPGGVGKTRLAAEVVPTVAHEFRDGVWWVDLGGVDPAADVRKAVARALAIRDVPHRSTEDLLVGTLKERRVLLVLDTCEHVVEQTSGLVHRILARTRHVHVLATSVQPLRIASEHVLVVGPLELPHDGRRPDIVLASDAVRLLLDRADNLLAGIDFREQAGHLAEIAIRLDGLPLAIELAASRLRGMSPRELAERLDDRFRLLVDGDRAAPPRHRTLQAVLEWTFQLLEERDQRLLSRLAVFPATFDAHAAEAVGHNDDMPPGDVTAGLLRLLDRSLVKADVGSETTRYRLHNTVRAFATQRAARDELTETRNRHACHYTQLAQDLAAHMTGPDLIPWLRRGHVEHENFLLGLRWLLEQNEGDQALHLASSLGLFWYRTGYLKEGRRLLERALEVADDQNPRRTWAMTFHASLAMAMGDARAVELGSRAVTYCEGARQVQPLGWSLAVLAFALLEQHRPDEALEAARRASKIFSELGEDEGVANSQLQTGVAYLQQRDLKRASAQLNASLRAFRRIRGTHAGWVLVYLSETSLARGDTTAAIRWANQAVADFREREDARGLAAAFVRLARAYGELAETARAAALLREAADIAARFGYRTQAAEVGSALGSLAADASSPT